MDEQHSDVPLTVGRLAELAGVTVRTLHHYDEIGLVTASARTAAGYRVYAAGRSTGNWRHGRWA